MSAEDGFYAGSISKQHGAWLISASDPSGDRTPDECFDAAAGQATARRILRETAEAFGFTGRASWVQQGPGLWFLYFTHSEDDEGMAGASSEDGYSGMDWTS